MCFLEKRHLSPKVEKNERNAKSINLSIIKSRTASGALCYRLYWELMADGPWGRIRPYDGRDLLTTKFLLLCDPWAYLKGLTLPRDLQQSATLGGP
jgi:hypothetical protein